ncbi:M20 family metallopeptidase [Microbacterium sp. KR10-403]|uniref:M20 metallopeptidase family protein n=1 Tax=Microbacterium sp. KR10-403 TaxID=3158581 RepID=UPI0032E46A82
MTLRTDAARLLPDLVRLRRRLHADPEVGFDLPRTQATVLAELDALPLEVMTGRTLSSVTAVLRGAAPGPAVLLRADMDALPIVEQTGLAFSASGGAMHACGHDLHTAGLIGAARLLAARRERIAGSVVLMFQPGEEAGGGAPRMIAEGVLDAAGPRVCAAYGIHVLPGRSGVFSTRPGPLMAGANLLHVQITGRGGHGSRPHQAVDPVPVLAELVLALQTYTTRRVPVSDPVVISVTRLHAGDAVNVIPDNAGLSASVRTLSATAVKRLRLELPVLVREIAAAYGCRAETTFEVGYPVTVNDAVCAIAARDVLRSEFGPERVETLESPIMASEDFSFVLDEVPGAFVFVGATPTGMRPEDAEMNHSPRAVFDDAILGDQAAALAALALRHVTG